LSCQTLDCRSNWSMPPPPIAEVHQLWLHRWMIAALVSTALLSATSVQNHPRTYLASIAGLKLNENEYIDSFAIETWSVTLKAVCHFPPGWSIEAGSSADPTGEIKGEGSLGVTYLNNKNMSELTGLVLITLYAPVQNRDIGREAGPVFVPATFKGYASVGTYGEDDKPRKIRLSYQNIRLVPADRCPRPRD